MAAITDFLKTVEDLLCRDPAPSVGDFLLSEKNPDFENVLTASNKKFLKGYESEFGERGITVADLQQNPKKRPRWGYCVMPTLTTGCSKMVHIPSQRLFSQSLGLIAVGPVVSRLLNPDVCLFAASHETPYATYLRRA